MSVPKGIPYMLVMMLVSVAVAHANNIDDIADPTTKGLAIAQEASDRDEGFGDTRSDLQMILRNRHGQETSRQMRSRTLEKVDDGDKGIVVFDDPADVKGTALLTFTHKEQPDDQWLFLPALKRVKRIASSNKSGPFMGSEFAYEDLASQEVEKYEYKWLRDETIDAKEFYVFERFPRDKKSGYTRQVVWLDKSEFRVFKVEYYDRKKSHLKTLTASDFSQYLGKFWRPTTMLMENHQTGKSTLLTWQNYKFGNGFTDADFNRNSLSKIR